MRNSRFVRAVTELWSVLDPAARRTFCLLIVSGTVGAVFEILAILGLSRFVSMLVSPGLAQQSESVRAALASLGVHDDMGFTRLTGGVVVLLLLISNCIAGLNAWLNLRFASTQEKVLTARLLEKYLRIPYVQMVKLNSADLLKNLLSGVATGGVMRPFLVGLIYAIVATLIVCLVIIQDPMIALGLGGLVGTAYWALSISSKSRLGKLGEETHHYQILRYRASQEALGGVKPVKVSRREKAFVARYADSTEEVTKRQITKGLFDFLPRYFLEVITFGGIISVVLFQLWRGDAPQSILPALALYTFAGYRLIPAIHHVYSNWTEVQFHAAGMSEIVNGLNLDVPELTDPAPLRFESSLELKDVTFLYNPDEPAVLSNLTLRIEKGQSVGVVGPTGAGKSTLIDIILGLLRPTEGQLIIDGHPITTENVRGWQANLGFVPQDIFLLDDTLERNIAFGLSAAEIDAEKVVTAARTARIDEFISELPHGYQTSIGERGVRLSGGQRQRVGIARSIYSNPPVVVLDEATSALDNITEREVVNAIRELAKTRTVITIAHRLSTVKDCDQIFVLSAGQLVEQGTYNELMSRQGVFSELAARASAESQNV